MTPLISAETWLGAAGCASGSQTCSGTRPAFEPAPSSIRISTSVAAVRRMRRGADRGEIVVAGGTGQQAERQQQRQRAEARHHQIDVAGLGVAGFAMMRHHQRPGRQRHELPAQQIGERVVGQHHQIHAGEEGGEERQHALRRVFVAAVADAIEAGDRAAEIDDDEEERRQRVEAEMRAEPRQPDRQRDQIRLGDASEQKAERAAASRPRRSAASRHRRRRWRSACPASVTASNATANSAATQESCAPTAEITGTASLSTRHGAITPGRRARTVGARLESQRTPVSHRRSDPTHDALHIICDRWDICLATFSRYFPSMASHLPRRSCVRTSRPRVSGQGRRLRRSAGDAQQSACCVRPGLDDASCAGEGGPPVETRETVRHRARRGAGRDRPHRRRRDDGPWCHPRRTRDRSSSRAAGRRFRNCGGDESGSDDRS